MSNQVLTIGGLAIGLVVIATLIVLYFVLQHRRALLAKGARQPETKPEAEAPDGLARPERAVGRADGGALVHMVIDAQNYGDKEDGQDVVHQLDVVRIRVPDMETGAAFGRKDGMSLLLQVQYFDMIKKMGASCRDGK